MTSTSQFAGPEESVDADFPVTTGFSMVGTVRSARLALTACEQGLTGVRLVTLSPDPPRQPAPAPGFAALHQAISELEEYFAGERRKFEVPLCTEGSAFQEKVWKALRSIPYGQTRSYWWVAVRIGDPRATRAVGAANGANPLPIIVPCHRVVRQDGSLGGFSAGLDWKRFLLSLEGVGRDLLSG